MKNILTLFSVSIISTFLFNSCGSSKSFDNKRYNNNYYIGMSKKENVKAESSTSTNETDSKSNQELAKNVNTIDDSNELATTAKNENATLSYKSERHEEALTLETEKSESTHVTNSFEKLTSKNRLNKAVSVMKDKFSENQENSADRSGGGAALSLFWIIILILLILWALGWSFGGLELGGVIHVLAVIALILLILWLLRVI